MTRPLIVFAAALLSAAPLPAADNDWTGNKVMPRKAAEQLTFTVRDATGAQRNIKPFEVVYKVLQEQGGWVRLWTPGQEGWGLKTEWVLLQDAPAFYTGRMRADPNDTWALSNRGVAWEELEEYDNAIKDYTEIIRREPDQVSGYGNRGNVYVFKREYEKAVKDFSEAIRIDPADYLNYHNRGWAYLESKDYDRAVRDFNQAIRLNPKYAKAFYNRGRSHQAQRDYEQAVRDYSEAVRIDPKYTDAANAVAWLLATCPEAKYRDGQKAYEYIKAARDIDPDDINLMDTAAAVYAECEDFTHAVEFQQKAIAGLKKNKDNEETLKAWKARLELYKKEKPYREDTK